MNKDNSYNYSVLLSSAYRILRNRAYQCLEKYQLIPTHWSLLGVIDQTKTDLTVSEVATLLGVKLPLVTVMVDYLEGKGLLNRVANDADGRSKLLVLTAKGSALVAVIEDDIRQSLAPLLAGVSTSRLRIFQDVLQAIVRNETT